MIAFNQEQAANSDSTGGNYNSQVDVYKLKDPKWVDAKAGSEARSIELTAVNKDGQEFRYLSIFYTKRDGSQNDIGMKQIQAMMGLLGVQNLTNQGGLIPELNGKFLKLALERENYIKGDGSDGFKFNMRGAFDYQSGQSYPEKQASREPEAISYWVKRFADQPNGIVAKSNGSQSRPVTTVAQAPAGDDFNDDIPW